jgi:hypothetical protein
MNFWFKVYDLKLLSFLKSSIKSLKNLHILKYSYLLKIDKQKDVSYIGRTINIFYNNLQKHSLKYSFV